MRPRVHPWGFPLVASCQPEHRPLISTLSVSSESASCPSHRPSKIHVGGQFQKKLQKQVLYCSFSSVELSASKRIQEGKRTWLFSRTVNYSRRIQFFHLMVQSLSYQSYSTNYMPAGFNRDHSYSGDLVPHNVEVQNTLTMHF